MDRREFLKTSAAAVAGSSLFALIQSGHLVHAGAVPPSTAGTGPYGPLAATADPNGLLLPAGFTSRVVAVGGELVGGTEFLWPPRSDGAGTVATDDGGWIVISNSNLVSLVPPGVGSVSAIEFAPDGAVRGAYSILTGSQGNSGGCVTPWGTWLSCEEDGFTDRGAVWECDIRGGGAALRPKLGLFSHEAVTVDPDDGRLYLTQPHPAGLLYRFTPVAEGDLSDGTLEACIVADDGSVTWGLVADPTAQTAKTRDQVPGARVFPGGGGAVVHGGWLYFTSKTDHSVHGIDLAAQRYRLIWKGNPEASGVGAAVLSGCDTLAVHTRSGDLLIAEDGADMDIAVMTNQGEVAPLVRVLGAGAGATRVSGVAFDPTGTRLYLSAPRAVTPRSVGEVVSGQDPADFGGGIVYEVSGPFRGDPVPQPTTTVPVTAAPTTVPVTAAPSTVPVTVPPTTLAAPPTSLAPASSDSGGSVAGFVGGGLLAVALAGGYTLFRTMRNRPEPPAEEEEIEVVDDTPPPAPEPVQATPAVVPEAVPGDDPAPTFADADDDESSFRSLLDPADQVRPDAVVLYQRQGGGAGDSSNTRSLLEEEGERLATPIQWKADSDDQRPGSDTATK